MPESDPRLSAELTDIAGSAPGLKAYLAKPTEGRKFPAVMVVHENRGLNPQSGTWRAGLPSRASPRSRSIT